MKNIQSIQFHTDSREELLPGFTDEFPYIASRAELDKYIDRSVPWHWHRSVELFYMESGTLEYYTPEGRMVFPAGSGGMVNSNILHMTKAVSQSEENIQLLHLFDLSLIGGEQGSRIQERYVIPITAAPQIEIIQLLPGSPAQEKILKLIRKAFCYTDSEFGYEIKLRGILSEIWLLLYEQALPMLGGSGKYDKNSDKIKMMMAYIHEHYAEKIAVSDIAESVYLSERECFRVFHDCLHTTPAEYMKNYRLRIACRMLAKGHEPVTVVSHACGLGSSSYFGKVFREYAHCTPVEYRKKWQDCDIERRK